MFADRLLAGILTGAAGGVAAGWWFGPVMTGWGWLGDLFLDALKMTILPLVVTAIISGIAPLGAAHAVGRAGAVTGVFIIASTLVATTTGVLTADIVQPGAGARSAGAVVPTVEATNTGLESIIRTLISPNLVQAAADGLILPIMLFALLLALALAGMGPRAQPVINLVEILNEAIMRLIGWILYLAPIGIFALLAARFGALGGEGFRREITSVGSYVVTVIMGLGVHFLTLCAVLILVRTSPLPYAVHFLRALVTAFGTGSSAATLPLAMDCARDANMREPVVRFVLPLGTALNRNGTALYQAAATMFIAQAYGMDMPAAQQAVVVITAALAGIATAGVPQHGLVNMVIVMSAVNLPAEGIGLILAVDWFLDRCRTVINVWGNGVGTAVVNHLTTGAASEK
ncbi:MAG: dicarboxylate/amino acid:cation symporter [Gammaproteobacteria bacterium]|nr:dicarboxylate/amino acid:cation symporter [Gammaproteobacteria bacterium]